MYRNLSTDQQPAIATAAASVTARTSPELAALTSELIDDPTGRGYAGKTPAQILALGSVGYWSENPQEQGRVSRGILPANQFYGDIVQAGLTVAVTLLPDNTPVPQGVADIYTPAAIKRLVNDVPNMQIVNTAADSVANMMGLAVAYGLLSVEQVTDLLTNADPAWNSQIWNEPRWTVLFGTSMPELADIVEALG